ncbi:hypothetical protein G7Y79_00046g082110 [Physcia stellaris]|nr:hypothetical protein G7Y79_00046g082110 [Physcia stellaris]
MSVHSTHLSRTHTFSKSPSPSITLLANHGVQNDAHAGKTRQDPSATLPIPKNLKQVHLIPRELLEDEDFRGRDGRRVRPGELGENITTCGVELGALGVGTRLVFVEGDEEGMDSPACGSENKQQPSSAENGTTEADTKPQTSPRNPKPLVADTTDFLLLTTMAVSALFLLLRHIPHQYLGLLLLFLGVIDFLRSTSHPLSPPPSPRPTTSRPRRPTIILTGLRNPCAKIDTFSPGLLAKSYVRDAEGKIVGARVGVMGVVEWGGVVRPGMRIRVEEPGVWVGMERI